MADDSSRRQVPRGRALVGTMLAVVVPSAAGAGRTLDSVLPGWNATAVALGITLLLVLVGLPLYRVACMGAPRPAIEVARSLAVVVVLALAWWAYGYSLAFDRGGMVPGEVGLGAFVGTLNQALLSDRFGRDELTGLPHLLHAALGFGPAVVAVALFTAEAPQRLGTRAVLWLTLTWFTLVYLPITHAVQAGPGAYGEDRGVIDAGGALPTLFAAAVSGWVLARLARAAGTVPSGLSGPKAFVIAVIAVWAGGSGLTGTLALDRGIALSHGLLAVQAAAVAGAAVWGALALAPGRPLAVVPWAAGAWIGFCAGLTAIDSATLAGPVLAGASAGIVSWLLSRAGAAGSVFFTRCPLMALTIAASAVGVLLGAADSGSQSAQLTPTPGSGWIQQLGIQAQALLFVGGYAALATALIVWLTELARGRRQDPATDAPSAQ